MKALRRLRKRLAESRDAALAAGRGSTGTGEAYQRGRRDAFDQALAMVVWEIDNTKDKEAAEW